MVDRLRDASDFSTVRFFNRNGPPFRLLRNRFDSEPGFHLPLPMDSGQGSLFPSYYFLSSFFSSVVFSLLSLEITPGAGAVRLSWVRISSVRSFWPLLNSRTGV